MQFCRGSFGYQGLKVGPLCIALKATSLLNLRSYITLMMVVHRSVPVNEIVVRIKALVYLFGRGFCDWRFHFGSAFRIRNLE
jgi:hypothetical protein